MELARNHVLFQDRGMQEIQWSKQFAWGEQNTDGYQIWAAVVNTNQSKLLFEINIVGKPRFLLKEL